MAPFLAGSVVSMLAEPVFATPTTSPARPSAPAPQSGAKRLTWVLRQVSQTYGAIETYMSSAGMRLDIGSVKVTLRPPDYRLVFWNEKSHYYFAETFSQFKKQSPPEVNPKIEKAEILLVEPNASPIAGLPVKHYSWQKWRIAQPKFRSNVYDFWVTRAIPLSQPAMDVCANCCYLPSGYGVPLKVTGLRTYRGKSKTIVFLNTEAYRKMNVPDKIYEPPVVGYEKVRSETEVLLKEHTPAREEDVSEVFKSLPKD